jgi:hypothetical protein
MGGPLKLKIGQKATIGENRAQKRFTNGHKSFTAAEAKALTETQLREKSTAEVFNNNKYNMCRERNPLTGEDTPRLPQCPGIPILNEHGNGDIYIPIQKEVTGKVNFLDSQELRNEEKRMNNRVNSLRKKQDDMSGELLYLKSKIMEKEKKVYMNLLKNRTYHSTHDQQDYKYYNNNNNSNNDN